MPQQAPPGTKQVVAPAPVKKTLPLASQSSPKPAIAKPAPPRPVSPPQPPPPPPEVCLRWNSYHSNMQATFPSLLNNEQFVDVTLACEGRSIKCHKVSTQKVDFQVHQMYLGNWARVLVCPPACDFRHVTCVMCVMPHALNVSSTNFCVPWMTNSEHY